MAVTVDNGIVNQPTSHSVEQTVERLEAILQAKGITVFALVDHRGEAAKVGMKMRPTKLLIFGNPRDRPDRAGGAGARESLYLVDAERLDQLAPDLILTQGICQVCAVGPAQVARAMPALRSSPEVLSLEPRTLAETFAAMVEVGRVAGRAERAERVVAGLGRRVSAVSRRCSRMTRRPRVAFLEWIDPPICGGDWNPELVEIAGGEDGLGRPGEPSRTVTWDGWRACGAGGCTWRTG